MSAVARLFGRKKMPIVPQKDIELGIVDTTPTAPLEPIQPTVNAIRNDNMPSNSRRVRYGMKYEYMPEEIRPLRSSLRQPNREMEMEMDDFEEYPRKYLKRRAPSPPDTPLVAAVYFRDNVPLFMKK